MLLYFVYFTSKWRIKKGKWWWKKKFAVFFLNILFSFLSGFARERNLFFFFCSTFASVYVWENIFGGDMIQNVADVFHLLFLQNNIFFEHFAIQCVKTHTLKKKKHSSIYTSIRTNPRKFTLENNKIDLK